MEEINVPRDYDVFPCPVQTIGGSKLLSVMQEIRSSGEGVPFILEDFSNVIEKFPFGSAEHVTEHSNYLLKKAESIDIVKWFRERALKEEFWWCRENWMELLDQRIEKIGIPSFQGYHKVIEAFCREDEVDVACIPVERAWMIPSYLNCGAYNDVPASEELSAIFKHWEDQYGAQLISINDNGNFIFQVSRPPKTLKESYILAREHHLFCLFVLFDCYSFPDPENIPVSGYGMIHPLRYEHSFDCLAQQLLNNNGWFFWFD